MLTHDIRRETTGLRDGTGEYLARHAHGPLLIAPVYDEASVRRWQALARVG